MIKKRESKSLKWKKKKPRDQRPDVELLVFC